MVLKRKFNATTENLGALNICDLFLHRGDSVYSTIENLFRLLCNCKKRVDANSHTLSTTQLVNVVSGNLFSNTQDVTLRKEVIALFAAYSSEPAQSNDSPILHLLKACFEQLPEKANIVPVPFNELSNEHFSFKLCANRETDTKVWGTTKDGKDRTDTVTIKESSLFHIESVDKKYSYKKTIIDRVQVLVAYDVRYSKRQKQCICICNPKVTVRLIGLKDEKTETANIPTCKPNVSNVCKKFYVSASGPVFPKDSGENFAECVLEANLDFLRERVFRKLDVSPTYFAIRLFAMLASVASDEIAVRSSFTKCTTDPADQSIEIVESRFIFSMPNLLYAVCLKYSVGTMNKQADSKTAVATKDQQNEFIADVMIETHKCERLERDIRSWVRFHVCDLPDLWFNKFHLSHKFEVGSKKIIGEHFASEYEDKLIAPIVESTTGDIDYCTVVHAHDNALKDLSLCVVQEEATKTIDLLHRRGLLLLGEKGINRDALSLLITKSVRNENTLNKRLENASGLLLLKSAEHCICFSRTVRQARGANDAESAKKNYNNIEEHFLYEIQGVGNSYVHVCASYTVGRYCYRYGRYRAHLHGLALYVRVTKDNDLRKQVNELPAYEPLHQFMRHVDNTSSIEIEVDCEAFKLAMCEISETARDVLDNRIADMVRKSDEENIQAQRSVLPEINFAALLEKAARDYYYDVVVDKAGMLNVIGDPVIRHHSLIEGGISYLNSLLETNTSRDVYTGSTRTSTLLYNIDSASATESTRELVKERIRILQRLRDSTSEKLHVSVLEAIANMTSSGESRDFIRYLTAKTIEKVGRIDDSTANTWYDVHIAGISLDVSPNLNEDGTGTIDLAQNYALAYGAWWSNKVAHFTISCTIDICRGHTKSLTLKFHNVRMGVMADHMNLKVLDSAHRMTNKGTTSFTKTLGSGQSIFSAMRFSLSFSSQEILKSTAHLGYTHVLSKLEEEDLCSSENSTILQLEYRSRIEKSRHTPHYKDIESELAHLIVKFIRKHGVNGILSSIPPHAESRKEIRAICHLSIPSYMEREKAKVAHNIDLTSTAIYDDVTYAENSATGAVVHSLVSSIRSNEYRNLRTFLSQKLSVHEDLDIEIANSAILDSPDFARMPHYPGVTASVDVLSTIRVAFNRQTGELKNVNQRAAAVLLSYTIAEHSILRDGQCTIGSFKLRIPGTLGTISQNTGLSASWKDCDVSRDLAEVCALCSIGTDLDAAKSNAVDAQADFDQVYDDSFAYETDLDAAKNIEMDTQANSDQIGFDPCTYEIALDDAKSNEVGVDTQATYDQTGNDSCPYETIWQQPMSTHNENNEAQSEEDDDLYAEYTYNRQPQSAGGCAKQQCYDVSTENDVPKPSLAYALTNAVRKFQKERQARDDAQELASKFASKELQMMTLCSEIFLNSGTYGKKSAKVAVHNALKSMACLVTGGIQQSVKNIEILHHRVSYSMDGDNANSISGTHSVIASYSDNASRSNLAMSFSFVLERDAAKNMISEDDEGGLDFYGNKNCDHVYSARDCVFKLYGVGKPLTEFMPNTTATEVTFPPQGGYSLYVPHTYFRDYDKNWKNIVELVAADKGDVAAKIRIHLRKLWSAVCIIVSAVVAAIISCFYFSYRVPADRNSSRDIKTDMLHKQQIDPMDRSTSHDVAKSASDAHDASCHEVTTAFSTASLVHADYSMPPRSDTTDVIIQPIYFYMGQSSTR
ncbi:hypothetical protein R4I06_02900 [Anaplasma bovis]